MPISIDINCDLGEFESLDHTPPDAAIMPYISSCNIACGGHAGNTNTIAWCVALAQQHDVAIGAHPSYPDRAHFGRQIIDISPQALIDSINEQVALLVSACADAKAPLNHIKPHGALYNQAANDPVLAGLLARTCRDLAPQSAVMGLAHSAMEQAAHDHGLRFIAEGFIDRSYSRQDALTPRSQPGSVHEDFVTIKKQALALATKQPIQTITGASIDIMCDSLCFHGDHPQAATHARELAEYFEQQGIKVRANR